MDKYPLTVRLDGALLKAVRVQAALTRSSLGSVVTDAARQSLMPEYREKQEQTMVRAVDRCFNRLVKMHEDQQSQHELIREMLAIFVRTFLRHTPAVKPEHKQSAWASAGHRFELILNLLADNRRTGRSVMDREAMQEQSISPQKLNDGPDQSQKPQKENPPAGTGNLFAE